MLNRRARAVLVAAVGVLISLAAFIALSSAFGGAHQRIEVVKVWSDQVDAPAGMVYYLLDVNASAGGPSSWNLDPSLFSLVSNASATYAPASRYNETTMLQKASVGPGAHMLGEVAFELPTSQAPARLEYHDPSGGVSLVSDRIPPVVGVASRFDPSVHFELAGASTQTGAVTADGVTAWAAISNSTNALAFFGGESGYRNYTFVFFSGQKISIDFAFYYYKVPAAPGSITVTSIASDDGYAVSSVLAWRSTEFPGYVPSPLPATMTGYGSNLEVTLVVTVPPGPQPGVLHFTVQFAPG